MSMTNWFEIEWNSRKKLIEFTFLFPGYLNPTTIYFSLGKHQVNELVERLKKVLDQSDGHKRDDDE